MLPRTHARTLQIVRLLRAAGPLPRRRRLPRQQHPDMIALEYWKAILRHVGAAQQELDRVLPEILSALGDERRSRGVLDAEQPPSPMGPAWQRARDLVERAARRTADRMDPSAIIEDARRFGRRTDQFNKEQVDRQVRAALSVPLSAVERPITEQLEGFAALNVDLIKSVPDRYFDRIRQDVLEAFEAGTRPDTLADDLAERYGMAENDAMRIARDQIGKLNGQLNEARQEAMGVDSFIWRTANDSRVRDSHAELDGETFRWDDPPVDDDSGETITPGSAINCRCYAEPIFTQILDDL